MEVDQEALEQAVEVVHREALELAVEVVQREDFELVVMGIDLAVHDLMEVAAAVEEVHWEALELLVMGINLTVQGLKEVAAAVEVAWEGLPWKVKEILQEQHLLWQTLNAIMLGEVEEVAAAVPAT